MSKLPALTGKAVVAALGKAGFVIIRSRSSHQFLVTRTDERRWFPFTHVKRSAQA